MKTAVGLRIDYKEALIVTCMNQRDQIRRIPSHVEEIVADADVTHVSQQERHDLRLDAHLTKYYGKVIGAIRHADAILIFGPGEAKGELKKRLKKANLSGRIVGMETVDKMTDHQIAAKVRQHFHSN